MAVPKALIIEDDLALSNICIRALDSSGFEARAVFDGQDALNQIDQISPAVVILDLHLPTISGQAILDHIRSNPQLTHTQIIIVSADAILASYLEAKADFVLTKPISYHQLRQLSTRLRSMFED